MVLLIDRDNRAHGSAPNIVLIMADDMGYECVSANGSTTYKTPHIDKLAAQGIRFTNCHSQPICTPSRVQIMTGVYNNRNYVRFGLLDPRATTFANLLQRAGYATCIAGKWQLRGGMKGPNRFGFDEYCLWQLTRRPSRYPNPGLEVNGKTVDYTKGEYGPDVVSDYLCDFIERHKKGPFLAYYPMMLPHWPFEPTPESADYDKQAKGRSGIGEKKYFGDMVAYTDKMVGKVVAKLDALGIRQETLVIFTCDNGTYTGITSKLGERSIRGGKGSPKDNGTHVPLVISRPGSVAKGKVSDALVDFSDILPTLTEFAGAKIPDELNLRGVSLGPLLRGEPFSGRKQIYCWYERNGRRGRASQHTRDRLYKLYSTGKFYHVVDDFSEASPLAPRSLTSEARSSYDRLKSALELELIVTAKATTELRKRGPGSKKSGAEKNKKQRKKKPAASTGL